MATEDSLDAGAFLKRFCTPECLRAYRDVAIACTSYGWVCVDPDEADCYLAINEATRTSDGATDKAARVRRDIWRGYVTSRAEEGDVYAADVVLLQWCARLDDGEVEGYELIGALNDAWHMVRDASVVICARVCYTLSKAECGVAEEDLHMVEAPAEWRLLEHAADLGHAPAMYELGMQYLQGGRHGHVIRRRDPARAHRLCLGAAENGYAPAWARVALDYRDGEGVEKDARAMLGTLDRGAEAGDAACCRLLGDLYSRGYHDGEVVIETDMRKASEYYRRSLELAGDAGTPADAGESMEGVDAEFTRIIADEFGNVES